MGLKSLSKKIKKENKEKAKTFEEKFIGELDKFLVDGEIERRKKESRLAFRPSQYFKCERQTYYFLNGFKGYEGIYPRSQRILQVGTQLHQWIQDEVLMRMDELEYPVRLLNVDDLPFTKEDGVEIIEEHRASPMEIKFLDTRFTEKFPISAMIDGALEYNNYPFLFEFKTINPTSFEYLIEPLPEHIMQGALYATCIGIRKVMFLYLCKGTQNLKAYLVDITDEQVEWVIKKIKTIEYKVINNILPDKEESNMGCRYCAYKKECKADMKKED